MNATFLFAEDNFGISEDYSRHYHKIGGILSSRNLNNIINSVYAYLDERYPDKNYRHSFPTVEQAINKVIKIKLSGDEKSKIINTFAHHEIGRIPKEYIEVLHTLSARYTLALVIDVWAPKRTWLSLFSNLGIDKLFSASSFSSDHGMVKPSPKPFELVVDKLGIEKNKCLVIGDSIRRDLGGASAAGIDCVLVGVAKHANALGNYDNLLAFSQDL